MVAPSLGMTETTRPKVANARGFDQKFLDHFWKLADSDASTRLKASLDILKRLHSANSTEAELNYTIGRLVQGLASTRQCARHGYYTTLVGILKIFPIEQLPSHVIHDTIKSRLSVEGTKKEKVDQEIGQILAYAALLKSGRVSNSEETMLLANKFIAGSDIKQYTQPITFGLIEELLFISDIQTFKCGLWEILKPKLTVPWEEQSFDTLNLLLTARSKFPKVIKDSVMKSALGSENLGDSRCFTDLGKFILKNASRHNHPVLLKIVRHLVECGTLEEFWTGHLDASMVSPTKAKLMTVFHLMSSAIKELDAEAGHVLLSKNILPLLVSTLQSKDSSVLPAAEGVLDSLQTVLAESDVAPTVQISIMERLLKPPGQTAFDRNTETRFVANITPSLKKETVMSIADIYRLFIEESSRTQERIAVVQQFNKLLSHVSVQREANWRASQLSFLARWAYFSPGTSKVLSSAMKEAFHRALDTPCKKLEDLSTVLLNAFVEINEMVKTSGDVADEVKTVWDSVHKNVLKIDKKQRLNKGADSWTGQVFLVLYLHMGFELLRNPSLPTEVISELDTCYMKASETKKQKKGSRMREPEEPHWLEVVTDILLSLLSRDQHLLRTVVVSVWSLLADHLTANALQQVLDVIDPTKKDMPLVDDREDPASGDDDSETSDVRNGEGSTDQESEEEEEEEDAEEDGDGSGDENGVNSDDEDEDEDMGNEDGDGMDDEETVTDKLRMRIHEALGDSAALTDTESVDIDDLSDGQMETLDKALSSAFQEFRKARPVRKNPSKLPKDQTALMHFRLRCLDLIDVLADKEVGIRLAIAALMPLLSLLEVTVKEPLQKPLMDRTRAVLRKLTNMRKFGGSEDVGVEDIVKLLQLLFSKPYAKRALMPYISDDLVYCCCFVLRCSLHLTRENGAKLKAVVANGQAPGTDLGGVCSIYLSNLSRYFMKRDSPIPFGVFSRALTYPWPNSAFLLGPLTEYAFGPSILKNRKVQAVQLLTSLYRNSTALSTIDQTYLMQGTTTLLQHSRTVLETAVNDMKPKYFNELFILLRVVFECPELSHLKDSSELWEPLKEALASFLQTSVAKQKELRKSCGALTRLLNVADKLPSQGLRSTSDPTAEKSNPVQVNGVRDKAPVPSKKRTKHAGNKEKKEAKRRRMALSAEGLASEPVFSHADIEIDEAPDVEPVQLTVTSPPTKTTKKKKDPSLANRKEDRQDEKLADEEVTTEITGRKKKKNMRNQPNEKQ